MNQFNRSVMQPWTTRISLMQQSVLMGIVRGPDGVPKYHPVKPILRWYRRCLLLSAIDGVILTNPTDPGGGSFTGPSYERIDSEDPPWQDCMDALFDKFMQHMDEMPIHYWLHMTHAIEIMGYKHDNPDIAWWWRRCYVRMVEAMHVWPERETQLDRRLGDTLEGWKARSDRAITK